MVILNFHLQKYAKFCYYFAMIKTLKIIFMASPDFALPSLQALYELPSVTISAVFSRPDTRKGRHKQLQPTPIKAWAINHHIETYTPTHKEELAEQVQKLNPDLIFVIAYGMILPKSVTDHYMCINVHGSLLPHYRGASPIHASLLHNDTQTGVTLIHMNEKMDEGDMIMKTTYDIDPKDNFQHLHDTLAQHSAEACASLIHDYPNLTMTPQDHTQASYCSKLTSDDFELKDTDSLQTKQGKIRAFSPAPGAFIFQDGKRIKILEASVDGEKLIPIRVKPEGKREMSYRDYTLSNPPLTL